MQAHTYSTLLASPVGFRARRLPRLVRQRCNPNLNHGRARQRPCSGAGGPACVNASDHAPHLSDKDQEVETVSSSVAEDARSQRRRLWMQAIKPPMYSVGYVPVLVGAAAVFLETGTVPLLRVLGFLVAAISVIAWLNLSNDAFDAATGVDASKPESVVNLTGNWSLVFWLSIAFLAVGISLLGFLISFTRDTRVVAMLALSIACGYVYQGPPFRLSYKGLGEPLCFLAFGPSATPAFYLALQPAASAATKAAVGAKVTEGTKAAGLVATAAGAAGTTAWSWPDWLVQGMAQQPHLPAISVLVWGLSLLVGASTTLILFTSHFHQIKGDKAAGKNSPLVRLGVDQGVRVLTACVVGVYMLAAAMVCVGVLPGLVLLPMLLLSTRPAQQLLDYAMANKQETARLALLKRFTCMWHIALGSSLVIGLVGARLWSAHISLLV